jgi:hypothetical protein
MMRKFSILTGAVVGLAAGCFALPSKSEQAQGRASFNQLVPFQGDGFSGIKLPIADADISQIFSRPDGGLVIRFTARKDGQLYSGFYDVRSNKRLSQNLELEMAHNNQISFDIIKSNNLKAIYPFPLVDITSDLSVQGDASNRGCAFPYYDSVGFYSHHRKTSSIAILIRLPKRQTHDFSCEYAENSPPRPAKVKFEPIAPSFYLDGQHGFYVKNGPYLIHFDRNGHSKFFAGRNDIVSLPGGRLDDFARRAESSNSRSWQPFIDEADRVIEKAVSDQGGRPPKQ